jgi:hypothetical protein
MNRRDKKSRRLYFTKNGTRVTRLHHVLNANVLLARQIEPARELAAYRRAGTKIGDRAL